ncbi:MAG: TIGR04255 family protein [Planctomycetaceae bacterium]|nr:TIGR04255 family protein [Planctomycetota bacterium]NUN51599.1 TIGR04255 family protein [Planctomycetaceae bacterium]
MTKPVPVFKRPPLIEVALSVQFSPLEGLALPLQVEFGSKLRARFPKSQTLPPLGPIPIEDPTNPPPVAQEITVMMQPVAFAPRLWFLNNSGTRLVQLQSDRFAYNWRKESGDEAYPKYPGVRDAFAAELRAFYQFCKEKGVAPPEFNQCEVIYVDHIFPKGEWAGIGNIHEVFSVWAGLAPPVKGAKQEDLAFQARFRIDDGKGKPRGRLTVSSNPATLKANNQPIQVLQMIARGSPIGSKDPVDTVLAFMDLAHERIVGLFEAMTTPAMHKEWGRENG